MYHYLGCGLPDVFLKNGYQKVKTPYGEGVVIHDVPGLHSALAEAIVNSPDPLVGAEFRFVRQELELSQAVLGGLVGRDEQAVARWEKGKSKMDPAAERLLRLLYKESKMGSKRLGKVITMLNELESVPPGPRKFVASESAQNWHAEPKAVSA